MRERRRPVTAAIRRDFNGTTNPNHVAAGFPTDCSLCHTTTAWSPSTFNHTSVFPLTGAHATVPCAQCHTNNNYTTLPTNCYGCHQSDWNGTTNPNHAAAAFPTTCDTCHTTTNWTNVNFNHAQYANYPLTGMHATLTCAQCHTNNNYTNTPTACYSCHQADFTGTTNPNHVASGFPTDCSLCHTTSGWSPSSFNHASVFPLTGAHATVACAQCHTNNNYTTLPTTCFGCHQTDWNGTTNPNHAAAGFPTTCDTCHTTTNWTNVNFNHAQYANYPLTGIHATLTCTQCHTNNNYTNTPTACYSCHQADFNGTTNPNHVTSGFPTDCSICHTTSGWSPSSFNHNNTGFPLTGAHTTVACTAVPYEQQLHNAADCVLRMPPGRLDWNDRSESRSGGLPHHLRYMPHHDSVDWGHIQSQQHAVPADGRARQCGLHQVPHQQRVRGNADGLLLLPPGGLHRDNESESRNSGLAHNLHHLPHHDCLASGHTADPVPHLLPAESRQCQRRLRDLPYQLDDYSVFQCTGCHTAAATNPKHQGVSGYVYNSVNCYACHKNGNGG